MLLEAWRDFEAQCSDFRCALGVFVCDGLFASRAAIQCVPMEALCCTCNADGLHNSFCLLQDLMEVGTCIALVC
jgi:hypothetical protein